MSQHILTISETIEHMTSQRPTLPHAQGTPISAFRSQIIQRLDELVSSNGNDVLRVLEVECRREDGPKALQVFQDRFCKLKVGNLALSHRRLKRVNHSQPVACNSPWRFEKSPDKSPSHIAVCLDEDFGNKVLHHHVQSGLVEGGLLCVLLINAKGKSNSLQGNIRVHPGWGVRNVSGTMYRQGSSLLHCLEAETSSVRDVFRGR